MMFIESSSLLSLLWQAIAAIFPALILYLAINELLRYLSRNTHFPGPSGTPIFGNFLQLQSNAPEQLRQWSKQYGEVFQIQFGNVPILVINSAAAAKELLSHQGHAFNSRPVFHTFGKVVASTGGFTIGTSPMNADLKRRRRAAAGALNKPSVGSYAPLLHLETNLLIKDILMASEVGEKAINPMPLIRKFALSVILTINWGTSITAYDQALFKEITQVEEGIVSTRSTTENLQDYIPILRLNPVSARSNQAESWRDRRDVYLAKLDKDLREKIEKGINKPCIQSNAILDSETKLSEQDLRTISTSMIQGGTGTISGTLSWAMAFLSQHPEIQTKAHKEIVSVFPNTIDAFQSEVVGKLDQLPYLHALSLECLRYFTVLRLSLPRFTTAPATWQNKPIPPNSTIFLNAWACNLDPEVWTDPEVFRPERWIEQPEAPLFTFGIGYRMCAGSALAMRELELVLLKVITGFEIHPVKGGKEVDVSPWTGSSNVREGGRFPKTYEVIFRPRDEAALKKALENES